jgi:SMC interacting uncharacterized protein involved in chromosome segregation
LIATSYKPDPSEGTLSLKGAVIGKMFINYFKFIASQFDGEPWRPTTGKKFEDDVLSYLKSINYPYVDSISKSHIQTPGNTSTWPGLLAMLHWMVMCIRVSLFYHHECCATMVSKTHEQLREQIYVDSPILNPLAHNTDALIPDEFNNNPEALRNWDQKRIWLDWIVENYRDFLDNDDWTVEGGAKARFGERFRES